MADEVNLYEFRTMLEALEQRVPPRSFLLDTFFSNTQVHDTETVDIDIVQGKRRLAPFVNRNLEAKLVERNSGFRTLSYKPPYIKPKMITTSADIMKRAPGQTIYGNNQSPFQRASEQLGKDLATLEDMIVRREEWMASMALVNGSVRVIGEGVDDTIDFLMKATHKPVLAGTAKWSDAANCKPLSDLRAWKRIISQDSGLVPTDVIMGTGAYDKFLSSNQVSGEGKLFDLMRITLGQIEPRDMGNGVTYIGRIVELGIDIWTYEDWYISDTEQTEEPMIPANAVIMGSRAARTTRHYGAINDLSVTGALKRFPKSWTVEDPSAQIVMVQSAPLIVPHQVDAFLSATVY